MLIWNDNFCGYSDHVCSSPAYQEGEHAGGLQDLAEYGHIPPCPTTVPAFISNSHKSSLVWTESAALVPG